MFGVSSTCKHCSSTLFREYYESNRGDIIEKSNARTAHIKQATPSWANKTKIKEIYNTCPIRYHVDHIVPLQGTLVCGLHVENNLQHLPASENLAKSNTWEVS